MRPSPFALIALLLLAATAAAAAPPEPPPKVPPIAYTERTLANGLKVYAIRDTSTPNVSVQVWYNVGAKNDPRGRSGFAHLFEHLMFKATRDLPAESFDRLTEDVGGVNNASTSDDFTNYWEVVPANHLERLLWAEAERMSGLVVDEASFRSERAVVEEELRMRVLADPYGRLFALDIPEAGFTVHPYHRPPIGSIEDLEQASLADVRAFHAVYYRPDNANLIVVGNFDPKTLDAWVDRYFGPIARPAWPIPGTNAHEPLPTAPREIRTFGPNVPLPAVVIAYPGPTSTDRDAAALEVLDAILTTGKSSRLYDALVYRDAVAQTVFSSADLRREAGLIYVGAIVAGGRTEDQAIGALETQIARLKRDLVSPETLEAARNQLLAGVIRARETIDGKGYALGSTLTTEGDAARVNSDVEDIRGVTAEDVRRVARRWYDARRRLLIRYDPESARPKGAPDVLVEDDPKVRVVPLVAPSAVPVVEALAPDLRAAPPAAGPPVPARLPVPVTRRLPNGLTVVLARTGPLPIVTASLTFKSGAAADPADRPGLTSMTVALLAQGTRTRSARQIASSVEALGGALMTDAGRDSASVTLSALSGALPRSLPILADVVRAPAFTQGELDRLRKQRLDALSLALQDPGALADLVLPRVVFAAGPYGGPIDGAPRSLARIDRDALLGQYARIARPDAAVLTLTGDIDPDAAYALAARVFGDWRAPAGPPAPERPPEPAPGRRVVAVDLKDAGQAAVLAGAPSLRISDPDYYRALVANAVLGGGYSSRLNLDIRVRRGLSYGAGSSLSAHRDGGLFEASAQTKNASAPEVAGLLASDLKALESSPPDGAELAARKSALVGEFGRAAATSGGLAGLLAGRAAVGLDPADVARFPERIEAVDAAGFEAGVRRLADPDALSLVIVGDAASFLPALTSAFPEARVVDASRLDLDAADPAPAARP